MRFHAFITACLASQASAERRVAIRGAPPGRPRTRAHNRSRSLACSRTRTPGTQARARRARACIRMKDATRHRWILWVDRVCLADVHVHAHVLHQCGISSDTARIRAAISGMHESTMCVGSWATFFDGERFVCDGGPKIAVQDRHRFGSGISHVYTHVYRMSVHMSTSVSACTYTRRHVQDTEQGAGQR